MSTQTLNTGDSTSRDSGAQARQAHLEYLGLTLRTVAHDPRVKVIVGPAGGGSYMNMNTGEATLDANLVYGDYKTAIFVSGHEGMHWWLSPKPEFLPLTKAEKEGMFSQVGFASTYNLIEDCAGNDGMVRAFVGLEVPTKAAYAEQLKVEGGLLALPEVLSVATQLGKVPRFSRALAAMLADWSDFRVNGDFNSNFADRTESNRFNAFDNKEPEQKEIKLVLLQAFNAYKLAVASTVKTGKESKADILKLGLRRFYIMQKYVFPHIQKLVAKDLKDIESQQAASDALNKGQQGKAGEGLSDNVKKALEQAAQEGFEKGAKNSADNFDQALKKHNQISDETEPNDQSDPKAKKELSKEELKKLAKELSQGDSSLEERLKKKIEDGRNLDDDEKGELQEAFEAALKDKQKKEGLPLPIDISKLDDQTKKELQKIVEELTPEEKEALRSKAKKVLEKLDDAIATELASKDPALKVETHADRDKKGEQLATQTQNDLRQQAIQDSLRRLATEATTPYQRLFGDVVEQVNSSYERLKHLFKPEDDETWRGAYASGAQLNIQSALQFEADSSRYDRLFDRREDPTTVSYAFELIGDRSYSMKNYGKLDQTKRAIVYMTELLTRLVVPHEMLAFNNGTMTLKSWQQEIANEAVQKQIAENLVPSGDTNDAAAIRHAYERIKDRKENHKYIIMFSDAGSTNSHELRQIVETIEKERKVKLVHFGVGPGTKDTNNYYATSYGDLPITASSGQKSFFEFFCEKMEQMILTPEMFLKSRNNRN